MLVYPLEITYTLNMKIITQTETNLVAIERNTSNVVFGIILFAIGGGVAILGTHGGTNANLALIIGIFFALVGLIFIVIWRRIRLELDKPSMQITLTVRSLIGGNQHQIPFSQVLKVQLVTSLASSMNQGRTSTTRLTKLLLLLTDGTSIDLSDKSQGMRGNIFMVFGKIPNVSIGQTLAQFIGVPFEQPGTPDISQVFGTVMNAIRQPKQPTTIVDQSASLSTTTPVIPTPIAVPAQPSDQSPPNNSAQQSDPNKR